MIRTVIHGRRRSGLTIRFGYITVATPTATPTVRLQGDSVGVATRNYVQGYTPVYNQYVAVLVEDNKRICMIGIAQ